MVKIFNKISKEERIVREEQWAAMQRRSNSWEVIEYDVKEKKTTKPVEVVKDKIEE